MTPTFDEIKEQYASAFLNPKTGKWTDATQSKVPTDPVITFNGQIINPVVKRTPGAQVEAYKAFKLACRAWNKTQNKGRSDASTMQRKPNRNTKEARIKENLKKKEERKQLKEEAANLIWWIVYPAATVYDETGNASKIHRLNADKELALNNTFVAMTQAQDWMTHAIKNKLSVSILQEDESEIQGDESETSEETASVTTEETATTDASMDETCSEYSMDETVSEQSDDEFARLTSIDGDGNVVFGPPTWPWQNMQQRREVVYSAKFQTWVAQQVIDISNEWEPADIVPKYSQYNYTAHKFAKHHWDVTCLEAPLDMNCFFKWKVSLPKELVTQCLEYLEIGKEPTDIMLYPEVSRMKHTFPVARYLAWGYCADGHKNYDGCDHTPQIGLGDIDFEAKHLKAWLRYAIKIGGVTKLSNLMSKSRICHRTWYESFTCQAEASTIMFNRVYEACVPDPHIDLPMSTPAVRRAKLLAHVDEPLDEVGIFILYLIMAHHRLDPELVRKMWLEFMVRENTASNTSICFVGRSKSGKSRIIEGFEQLLNGRSYDIQKNTAYSYRGFNDKTLDFCYINELRDKLRDGSITPGEVGDYWEDTGKFNQFEYCDECPSHLPFLSNSQSMHLESKSGDSTSMQPVYTRINPIFMSGGPLPKDVTWKHGWKVTGPVPVLHYRNSLAAKP